ncbi:MAG: hemolysin family protein, partial [Acidobacteriota bacterium]
MGPFLWTVFGILLILDLILSVSRSAFFNLGFISRKRILEGTPLLGKRILAGGYQVGFVRVRMSLQLGQQFFLVSIAFLLYRGLRSAAVPYPLAVAFAGTIAIAVVWEQAIGRILAARHPERAFRLTSPLLFLVCMVFRPLTAGVLNLVGPLSSRKDIAYRDPDSEVPEEEIQAYIDAGEREGILEKGEGRLLQSIVEFGDTLVREVMTPRTEMITIEKTASIEKLHKLVAKEKHSRIPVYADTIDRIEGVIHIKDLIRRWEDLEPKGDLISLIRPAYFVPESKKVSQLLRDFQKERIQLSIVVDEYGGTAGLVTIEDLLEEIVGEIQDEHETRVESVVQEANGVYLVRG